MDSVQSVVPTTLDSSKVYDVEERNLLPSLLFTIENQKPTSIAEEYTCLADVVRTFAALCRRRSRPVTSSDTTFETLAEEEHQHNEQIVESFPIIVPGTVCLFCLFCLGGLTLSSHARIHAYARRAVLARHVHQQHLRFIHQRFLYPHPSCVEANIWLEDGAHFKNHAEKVQNVVH